MIERIKNHIQKNWVSLTLYSALGIVIAKEPFIQWLGIFMLVLAIDINSAIQAQKSK